MMKFEDRKILIFYLCVIILFPILGMSCSKSERIGENVEEDNNSKDINTRMATFNIRSSGGSDSVDWESIRINSVLSLFKQYDFDIVGVQEPNQKQIDDMMNKLGNVYEYFSSSTQNASTNARSHQNPIFYKKERFKILNFGTFWFSETPDVPGSESWDASQPRNCNWIEFYDKKKEDKFFLFNSHFDHISARAKNESAEVLLQKINEIAKNKIVFCTGDFNTNSNSGVFNILISSNLLVDTHSIAEQIVNDNYRTAHAYHDYGEEENPRRVDHIFTTKNFKKPISLWKCVVETFDGKFASDHFPVFIDF